MADRSDILESKVVGLSLSQIIDVDLEGFLDLLESKFFGPDEEGILTEITYEVVGFDTKSSLILIKVEGYRLEDLDDLFLK